MCPNVISHVSVSLMNTTPVFIFNNILDSITFEYSRWNTICVYENIQKQVSFNPYFFKYQRNINKDIFKTKNKSSYQSTVCASFCLFK
ncbi:hypothetical protein BpHYR1_023423 [Brachionus plicatilis]|uniref:Uncharacterized protein n=1 Tax=Brachionus plicatilis TaxID=10195 RepID=A0A3M7PFK2_BRAPC|nr:hypothetical protein BpHYR1_023423 [Brachionus plicatilis]